MAKISGNNPTSGKIGPLYGNVQTNEGAESRPDQIQNLANQKLLLDRKVYDLVEKTGITAGPILGDQAALGLKLEDLTPAEHRKFVLVHNKALANMDKPFRIGLAPLPDFTFDIEQTKQLLESIEKRPELAAKESYKELGRYCYQRLNDAADFKSPYYQGGYQGLKSSDFNNLAAKLTKRIPGILTDSNEGMTAQNIFDENSNLLEHDRGPGESSRQFPILGNDVNEHFSIIPEQSGTAEDYLKDLPAALENIAAMFGALGTKLATVPQESLRAYYDPKTDTMVYKGDEGKVPKK